MGTWIFIVLGTHGRHGLARVVLGSVAELVVRLSPVPVLTIPAKKPEETGAPGETRPSLTGALGRPCPGLLASPAARRKRRPQKTPRT